MIFNFTPAPGAPNMPLSITNRMPFPVMMEMFYLVPMQAPQTIASQYWPMKPYKRFPVILEELGTCRLCGGGFKMPMKLCYGVCMGCHMAHAKYLFTDCAFVWHDAKGICWMATPATN